MEMEMGEDVVMVVVMVVVMGVVMVGCGVDRSDWSGKCCECW
jgi:hypothetical protein